MGRIANPVVLRRTATAVYVVAALLFLFAAYVFLVFWENTIDLGAEEIARIDLISWVRGFAVALGVLVLVLLILYFIPTARREEALAEEEATPMAEGVEAEATFRPEEPEAAMAPLAFEEVAPLEPEAGGDALVVRCTNCAHEFDLPYTTQRPVYYSCPSCHEEGVLEEPESVLAEAGYPVIDIEGIGDVYAEKLKEVGIRTTEQLRVASVDRLSAQTGIPRVQLQQWKAMSDLIRLKGIGKQYAELLVRSGIEGTEDLARQTPTGLVQKIDAFVATIEAPPTKGKWDTRRAKKWIEAARKGELDKGIPAGEE